MRVRASCLTSSVYATIDCTKSYGNRHGNFDMSTWKVTSNLSDISFIRHNIRPVSLENIFNHMASWKENNWVGLCLSWHAGINPSHKSHNASFGNSNIYTRAHFSYKFVNCGIWDWCIVGCMETGLLRRYLHNNLSRLHGWTVGCLLGTLYRIGTNW